MRGEDDHPSDLGKQSLNIHDGCGMHGPLVPVSLRVSRRLGKRPGGRGGRSASARRTESHQRAVTPGWAESSAKPAHAARASSQCRSEKEPNRAVRLGHPTEVPRGHRPGPRHLDPKPAPPLRPTERSATQPPPIAAALSPSARSHTVASAAHAFCALECFLWSHMRPRRAEQARAAPPPPTAQPQPACAPTCGDAQVTRGHGSPSRPARSSPQPPASQQNPPLPPWPSWRLRSALGLGLRARKRAGGL